MFKNHWKLAWRNLVKDRSFTLPNIIGMSVGLASSLLIWLWVTDERSMDKIFARDGQIYQVLKNSKAGEGAIHTYEWTPGPLAMALATEMPEVEYGVTVVPPESSGNGNLSSGDQHVRVIEQYAGKDFFKVFSYPLLEGSRDEVLGHNQDVVLSDQLAVKLFRTTDQVVGRTVTWNKDGKDASYRVSGIFRQPTQHSTTHFDLIFSFGSYRQNNPSMDDWNYGGPNTYILLRDHTDPAGVIQKLSGFLQQKTHSNGQALFMRRYSDKYLFGKYENGRQAGGRITYVRLFSVIALFILVIACINFMNLATAKASTRLKEVGIKKVIGASRRSLVFQYIGESMLLTFLSMGIALLLVWLLLPAFDALTGKMHSFHFGPGLLFAVLAITFFTGLIAGSYPAIYLSGFRAAAVLKGNLIGSLGELWVRKGLVIFQFTMSVMLIFSVLVVYRQMEYVRSKDLGFKKESIISFRKDGALNHQLAPFLLGLRQLPGVVDASNFGNDLLVNYSGTDISWDGKSPGNKTRFKYLFVGYDFIRTLGIGVKEGRSFSPGSVADSSSSIILNEAAVAAMGLEDPVGKFVTQWDQHKRIIGVVKDFNFESLYEKVKPCFFILAPESDNVLVRIGAGDQRATIQRVRQYYQQYNPGFSFDFRFLDQEYQAAYDSEYEVAVLSRYFAGIAIIISCLGLFGLAAFTSQKRQREIGIRKVIGASAGNILAMLSADFLKPVLISVLIAFPLSWWAMNHWLQGFAYRVPIHPATFLLTGASVMLLTVLTVSHQSIRAAVTPPVKSLRAE